MTRTRSKSTPGKWFLPTLFLFVVTLFPAQPAPGESPQELQRRTLVLWLWDRSEDVTFLAEVDAAEIRGVEVAVLVGEVTVRKAGIRVRPRQSRALVPSTVPCTAVVHVTLDREAGDRLDIPLLAREITGLWSASRCAKRQIDFDELPRTDHARLTSLLAPESATPFSATVPASYCLGTERPPFEGAGEYVPMFFRMGSGSALARQRYYTSAALPGWCGTSVGIAVDEPLTPKPEARRIYLFSETAWRQDAFERAVRRYTQDR